MINLSPSVIEDVRHASNLRSFTHLHAADTAALALPVEHPATRRTRFRPSLAPVQVRDRRSPLGVGEDHALQRRPRYLVRRVTPSGCHGDSHRRTQPRLVATAGWMPTLKALPSCAD